MKFIPLNPARVFLAESFKTVSIGKRHLKRIYRLWKQQNFSLSKKRPHKPRAKAAAGIVPQAEKANQVWTYDFVFDQSLSGRSLKMLTLIDEFTRECLAVEVGISIKSERVRRILQKICADKGKPELMKSDNGSEFIGKAGGCLVSGKWHQVDIY